MYVICGWYVRACVCGVMCVWCEAYVLCMYIMYVWSVCRWKVWDVLGLGWYWECKYMWSPSEKGP